MVGGNLKPKVPDSRDLELDLHFSAPFSAHPLTKSKAGAHWRPIHWEIPKQKQQ
jgi:hypothetical protein